MAHLCELPTVATSTEYMCPNCGKIWTAMASAGGLSWREYSTSYRPEPDLFGGQK